MRHALKSGYCFGPIVGRDQFDNALGRWRETGLPGYGKFFAEAGSYDAYGLELVSHA
tara:strand:- start:2393 stop:2563 length:171 start_codon:yes stop_codon:yes gene_type:complete